MIAIDLLGSNASVWTLLKKLFVELHKLMATAATRLVGGGQIAIS